MTTLLLVPAAVPSAYQPDLSPVADSLALSALIALLPLVTVFVTLGVLKWKAHWAGLSAVLVAIIVAAVFFGMPVQLADEGDELARAHREAHVLHGDVPTVSFLQTTNLDHLHETPPVNMPQVSPAQARAATTR